MPNSAESIPKWSTLHMLSTDIATLGEEITSDNDTSFFWSHPRGGACEDPKVELDTLFARYIR